MGKLFYKTNSLLHSLDRSFPRFVFSEKDQHIRHEFFGKGYAHFTKEGIGAIARMEKSEGIMLDGTYTGKALNALIDDAKKQYLRDKVVLFWNTYNSKDFSEVITTVDYRQLPRCHRYFEEEVHPPDRVNAPSDRQGISKLFIYGFEEGDRGVLNITPAKFSDRMTNRMTICFPGSVF